MSRLLVTDTRWDVNNLCPPEDVREVAAQLGFEHKDELLWLRIILTNAKRVQEQGKQLALRIDPQSWNREIDQGDNESDRFRNLLLRLAEHNYITLLFDETVVKPNGPRG